MNYVSETERKHLCNYQNLQLQQVPCAVKRGKLTSLIKGQRFFCNCFFCHQTTVNY